MYLIYEIRATDFAVALFLFSINPSVFYRQTAFLGKCGFFFSGKCKAGYVSSDNPLCFKGCNASYIAVLYGIA